MFMIVYIIIGNVKFYYFERRDMKKYEELGIRKPL